MRGSSPRHEQNLPSSPTLAGRFRGSTRHISRNLCSTQLNGVKWRCPPRILLSFAHSATRPPPNTPDRALSTLFNQLLVRSVKQNPPFYLTRDPLELLRKILLLRHHSGKIQLSGSYDQPSRRGVQLSKRRVILHHTSAHLSDIFQCDAVSYTKFLPGGTLFVEVNTCFLLTLFVRLLASRQSLFPYIIDFPALFKRLNTAVGNADYTGVFTSACFSSRVAAELMLNTPRLDLPRRIPRMFMAEMETPRLEQSDEEDLRSEEDYDSDCIDSNDLERRAWTSSTEVLIPCTEDDSNAVLAALSGDIFTPLHFRRTANWTESWNPRPRSQNSADLANARRSHGGGARRRLGPGWVSGAMELRTGGLAAEGLFTWSCIRWGSTVIYTTLYTYGFRRWLHGDLRFCVVCFRWVLGLSIYGTCHNHYTKEVLTFLYSR